MIYQINIKLKLTFRVWHILSVNRKMLSNTSKTKQIVLSTNDAIYEVINHTNSYQNILNRLCMYINTKPFKISYLPYHYFTQSYGLTKILCFERYFGTKRVSGQLKFVFRRIFFRRDNDR